MSAITDFFERLQRNEYKNPKSKIRLILTCIFMEAVIIILALASHH